jgi:hypothetical protein
MRRLGLATAIAAILCGLLATAGSAPANEFVAAPEALTRGGSGTEHEQEFNFGPFQIQCSAARSKGSASSTFLLVTTRFSKCATTDNFGGQALPLKTHFNGALGLLYGDTGFAGLASAPEITIGAIKCTILLGKESAGSSSGGAGAGKVEVDLGGASFSNVTVPTRRVKQFPTGLQNGLMIDNEIEGIPFEYSGSCASFGDGEETGSYFGTVWDEAAGGDLEFVGGGEEWNRVKNNNENPPPGT